MCVPFGVFWAPKSVLRPIFIKSVFLLEKKEHLPIFQNPLSQNPLAPLLGEVPLILLGPKRRLGYLAQEY